jgi:hypothetical protein
MFVVQTWRFKSYKKFFFGKTIFKTFMSKLFKYYNIF